jgi:HD-GYP domain-containing protein (c-di-GMP phosphodiesterase class II)
VRQIVREDRPFPWDELIARAERVATSAESSADLVWAAGRARPRPGDHLALHQARVAVLGARIGANLGWDHARVVRLATAGCLIDVGLWKIGPGLATRVEALSGDEQKLYRSHPVVSAELLRRWSAPGADIVEAVLHHHEREHGQGFPLGIERDAIHPHGKLLALADAYTTLTLSAPPPQRLRPHDAIRDILRSKREAFSPLFIKALLSEVSVFPPGTRVRLNTGEVACVLAVNRAHPLRPRVEVVLDSKGDHPATAKTLDLAEAPFVYITGAVSEQPG